ncbi:MAG: MBL fold metallo-hydrolase [Bacillota bacterium]
MPVSVTCYGGIGEIGGNKILLEDGQHRLFFDFGRSFGLYGDYFDGVFVKERTGRGLLDPIGVGIIPPLEGLYRDDLLPCLDPAQITERVEEHTDERGRSKTRRVLERDTASAYEDFWSRFRNAPGYRDLRREGPAVDAILISHAHLDHTGELNFVRPEISTCSTRTTAFIAKAMQDSGRPSTTGVVYVNPQTLQESGLLKGDERQGYTWRSWAFLDGDPGGETDPSGPFSSPRSFWDWRPMKQNAPAPQPPPGKVPPGMSWWPLDHSVFGAAGFAVETSAGPVAYTGDLRFHGREGTLSRQFVEELCRMRPTALICEGSRVDSSRTVTEGEVAERCLQAVRAAAGRIVVADFGPRNVERLNTFGEIARLTGRRLLVQPKDAYLLAAIRLTAPGAVPDPAEETWLAVYDDPKGRQGRWEQVTRDKHGASLVGPREVKDSPGEYILALSLWDVADLLDVEHLLGGVPGGVYIYSNSQAYDDEQRVDLVRLWNWIRRFGMEPVGLTLARRDRLGKPSRVETVPGYHASGHASGQELLEAVTAIRPKYLIPVHTERPRWWARSLTHTGIRVRIPAYGRPIPL